MFLRQYLQLLNFSYRPLTMQIPKNEAQDNKLVVLISLLSYDLLRLLSIPSLHCLSIWLHDIYQLRFPIQQYNKTKFYCRQQLETNINVYKCIFGPNQQKYVENYKNHVAKLFFIHIYLFVFLFFF